MPPECGRGTRRVVTPHHHVVDRLRLFLARGKHEYALRGQYLVNTHRQRILRHKGRILERSGIRRSGARGQQRDMRRLVRLRVRLVERDVPVFAYAEDLDVRGVLSHRCGIPRALGGKILRHAVRDVRIRGIDVYFGEKIVAHEPSETRLVVRIHADVFVEVERAHTLVAGAVALVILRHSLVKRHGCIARGKSYHRVGFFVEHFLDFEKSAFAELFPVFYYCESHNATSFIKFTTPARLLQSIYFRSVRRFTPADYAIGHFAGAGTMPGSSVSQLRTDDGMRMIGITSKAPSTPSPPACFSAPQRTAVCPALSFRHMPYAISAPGRYGVMKLPL